jgi:hypothetical protein
MGILGALIQQAIGGSGGGMPGMGSPGGWPSGVPNPLGLPSPDGVWGEIQNAFQNPYGTNGSTPNPSPWGGINPFGTQVSGGNTNPWSPEATGATYRPPDPNDPNTIYGKNNWSFSAPLAQRPPDPTGGRNSEPLNYTPAQQQRAPGFLVPLGAPPPVYSGGHMGGGQGTGLLGQQWVYQRGNDLNAPWQHAMPGESAYGKGAMK